MSLPQALQSFAQGPAEIAAAKALSYDRSGGLALVEALAAAKLRSHLEALGEVASDKDVKKAARAAAYKLKSAGVAGGVQREAAVDLTVKIETEHIAAATAPGLDGRLWLVLPALPGAGGGEMDLREQARGMRLEAIQELSVGRVRKFQSEMKAERVSQPPALIGIDLAARLVDVADQALAATGKPVPPTMGHFRAWARRAVQLGADPMKASARHVLGPAPAIPEGAVEHLAAHPLLSFLAAPPSAFEAVDAPFRALLHGHDPIEKDDFMARGAALVAEAAKAWAGSADARKTAAMWLDATADVLMAEGEPEDARLALAMADDLVAWQGDDPLAHPLIARAFRGALDLGAAWMHREAHIRGDAHH